MDRGLSSALMLRLRRGQKQPDNALESLNIFDGFQADAAVRKIWRIFC